MGSVGPKMTEIQLYHPKNKGILKTILLIIFFKKPPYKKSANSAQKWVQTVRRRKISKSEAPMHNGRKG